MTALRNDDLRIPTLGPARVPSPLHGIPFVPESRRVLVETDPATAGPGAPAFEAAGPRARLYFRPEAVTAGIVTCGGLCPGLNNVIRSLVLTLHFSYGVRRILGFRYGYAGLAPDTGLLPLSLTPEGVAGIHRWGGTMLGTSRGPQASEAMAATLVRLGVDILFVVGGDGTMAGAQALVATLAAQGRPVAVVGIPKTIDNDLLWTERTFGFATAVAAAVEVIDAAHVEAVAARMGVSLVKLMGRRSGFIAAYATLASSDVNFCLVPEVPFRLEGEDGLFRALERRLVRADHAVIVVAEGAGQELIPGGSTERDASGNLRLKDIGRFLTIQLRRYLRARGLPAEVRYLDPSYTIRARPANAFDARFCHHLAEHAVHAGMAGKTGVMIGYWNGAFTHVPLALVAGRRKHLDPQGETWQSVLAMTGQPPRLGA